MSPRSDRVAEVSNLTLRRDAGRFTLQAGRLQLLTAVGGRTVGAVFRGKGVFSFVPANRIERERLRRLEKADSLEAPFTELLLVFADSTLEELDASLDFASAAAGGGEAGVVRQGLELLADQDSRTFEPDLMAAFLNGERSELFYAHIKRSRRRAADVHAESERVRGGAAPQQDSAAWLRQAGRSGHPVPAGRHERTSDRSGASATARRTSAAT